MSNSHKPRRGDPVNDRRRLPLLANGTVERILYDDGPDTVIVRFDRELVFYEYSEFVDAWTDTYGGVFILT